MFDWHCKLPNASPGLVMILMMLMMELLMPMMMMMMMMTGWFGGWGRAIYNTLVGAAEGRRPTSGGRLSFIPTYTWHANSWTWSYQNDRQNMINEM